MANSVISFQSFLPDTGIALSLRPFFLCMSTTACPRLHVHDYMSSWLELNKVSVFIGSPTGS